MDCIIRRKSALNNSNGTATGSKISKTILYAWASEGRIPKLLAARPTKVLTSAPLSALPILVFSDLHSKIYASTVINPSPKKKKNPINKFFFFPKNEKKIRRTCIESKNLPNAKSPSGEESSPGSPVILWRDNGVIQI